MPRSVRQPEKPAISGQKREQTKPRNYIFPHFFAEEGEKMRKNFANSKLCSIFALAN